MDALRLSAVTARVVAWHNRHPLARRITAAQVHAVGYVALPFVGEGVASAPGAAAVAAEAIATAAASSAAAAVAAAPLATLNDVVELPVDAGGLEIEVDDTPALADDPFAAGQLPDAPAVPVAPQQGGESAEAGNGSSLRERALARARQSDGSPLDRAVMPAAATSPALTLVPGTLKPNFSEDFIDPLRPRAVARFAARHGQLLDAAPNDGPVRQVLADGVAAGCVAAHIYVLTAVIETDTRKSRVLLGSGSAVMGRRIFSTPRLATVAALGAALVGVPLALWRAPAKPMAPDAAHAAAMSAAAAASSALPPAVPMAALAAEAAASMAVATPAEHAPAALATEAAAGASAATPGLPKPQDTPGETGASIVPRLSDEEKALARQARQALRPSPVTPPPVTEVQPAVPAPAAPPPAPAPAPAGRAPLPASLQSPAATAATAAAPPPRAAAPVAPAATVFAVSTRLLRTRAEAEQVSVAVRSLLRTLGESEAKVDVLPQGDDWRVVAMPFNRRADAEQARALLVSRGMRVEVLDF